MTLVFVLYWGKNIQNKIILYEDENDGVLIGLTSVAILRSPNVTETMKKKCKLNGYFVGLFESTLKQSQKYRSAVFLNLRKHFRCYSSTDCRIRVNMYNPCRYIIDYKWCEILNNLCYQKRELDMASSWLSTLGGAFSALGDYFENFAMMAGRVSIRQFKLALRFGDPQMVARCKLFYSLSLIQRGRLKEARQLVQNVYREAVSRYVSDKRLKKMCLGIWTKLQYEWNKKYRRRIET